jgi:2-amino-4-hydroxy-6-hydroxymethyldihydropteridine diphosphokinase
MNVAFLGLGGNMGDRLENLRKALTLLEHTCGEIAEKSSVYETEAWGSDSKNNYLNQVVKLITSADVDTLLQKMLKIELELGRKRDAFQNSDRTLDLDILLFNEEIINLNHIHIPHPRMHLRKFVLVPLCEIEPKLTHPVFKENIATLLKKCKDDLEVKLYSKSP